MPCFKISETKQWVEANGYQTKKRLMLEVAGQENTWYLLKQGAGFSVLFCPDTMSWLKLPEREDFVKTLELSYEAQLATLQLAGLANMGLNCSLIEICFNEPTIAMLSSHFGPTVQYFLKQPKPERNVSNEDLNHLYYQAWLLANELLVATDFWFDDPNPGNVVKFESSTSDGVAQPLLIDIIGKTPRRRSSPTNKAELKSKFIKQVTKYGLRGW